MPQAGRPFLANEIGCLGERKQPRLQMGTLSSRPPFTRDNSGAWTCSRFGHRPRIGPASPWPLYREAWHGGETAVASTASSDVRRATQAPVMISDDRFQLASLHRTWIISYDLQRRGTRRVDGRAIPHRRHGGDSAQSNSICCSTHAKVAGRSPMPKRRRSVSTRRSGISNWTSCARGSRV